MKDRVAPFVLGFEITRPVLPVQVALVSHRGPFFCRVMGADDGTGVGRRAGARGVQLVDIERLVALLRQFDSNAILAPMIPAPMMIASKSVDIDAPQANGLPVGDSDLFQITGQ